MQDPFHAQKRIFEFLFVISEQVSLALSAQHSDQARAAHGMACTILEFRYRQRDITTVQKPSHAPANTPENKMKQNFLGFIPFKPQW